MTRRRFIRLGFIGVLALALLLSSFPTLSSPALASPSPCSGCWPRMCGFGTWYYVHWGDTLSGISMKFGVPMRLIMAANGIWNPNCIYAGTWLWIPCARPHRWHPHPWRGHCRVKYVVKPGDTLSGIAWRFGVDMWALARINGIKNINYIRSGRVLCIP